MSDSLKTGVRFVILSISSRSFPFLLFSAFFFFLIPLSIFNSALKPPVSMMGPFLLSFWIWVLSCENYLSTVSTGSISCFSVFQHGFFIVHYFDFYPNYLLGLVFKVVNDFVLLLIVSDSDGQCSSVLSGFVHPGHVAFYLRWFTFGFCYGNYVAPVCFCVFLEASGFSSQAVAICIDFLGFLFCVFSGRVFKSWSFFLLVFFLACFVF